MTDTYTPRTLIRYTLYAPGSDEIDHVAYEAIQPNGTVGGDDYYDADVVGFAEFSPYTNVGRVRDFETFRDVVESKADYVHWKPPNNDQIGAGDCWADEHDELTNGGIDR